MSDIPCQKCGSTNTRIIRNVPRDCPYCEGDPDDKCMFCDHDKIKVDVVHCNACGWEY